MQYLAMPLNLRALLRCQHLIGRVAHHQIIPLLTSHLQHIPSVLQHLFHCDGNHLLTVFLEVVQHILTLALILNSLQAHHSKTLSHRHHYIRVVNRLSYPIHLLISLENHRGIFKVLTELNQ